MSAGVGARAEAATIVRRVLDEGAHSNVLLGTLESAEHATVNRLVLDTLRYLPPVDATIAELSSRPLNEVDATVRAALRVGVAELMTGGSAHGVVNSTVEVVKRSDERRAAGYVNAILRRVAAGHQPRAPDPATAEAWAVAAPPWMHRRLAQAWGADEADAFLRASLDVPRIGVRNRSSPGIGTPIEGIPGAAFVDDRSDVVAAGRDVVVMDPASTAVARAVEVSPGHRVLDVAAAPGNKSAALWDDMAGSGLLVAADRHAKRCRRAAVRLRRMGVDALWLVADGTRPPFRPGSFDRILLDAPCTGLGTVRRRPEIKSKLDPAAPERMAALQRRLVAASMPLVAAGGRLVYSVCTVFPEETTEIAEEFGGRAPTDLPGNKLGAGLMLGPHLTETDGMFITIIDG